MNEKSVSKNYNFAAVDELINQEVAAGFPGAVLLVSQNGEIIKHSAYGYQLRYDKFGVALEKPEVMRLNSIFDLASNTKMYATNYALMHLVSAGKLNLDLPICQYLPNYVGSDLNGQSRDERSVRDLLYHCAGYMPDPQMFNPKLIAQYGADLYTQDPQTTREMILERLPFAGARGVSCLYSDVDYILLGYLIEQITGVPLDNYMQKTFYQPLKLIHTGYNPLQHGFIPAQCVASELSGNAKTRGELVDFPNLRTGVIQGEVHDEKAFYSMDGVAGHAGLFSTAAELAQLMSLMLNEGRNQEQQFWNVATQAEFVKACPLDLSFGLGWRRAEAHRVAWFGDYASDQAIGHTGWTGTVSVIDPAYNLAIVLLTNKRHTRVIEGKFVGDQFATGQYREVINLVYQAII